MRRAAPFLVAVAAALSLAPAASAGTYSSYACTVDGTVFDNKSWSSLTATNVVVDPSCATKGTLMGLRVDAGKAVAGNAVGGLTFTSPAGTAITNFMLERQLNYNSPAVETRRTTTSASPTRPASRRPTAAARARSGSSSRAPTCRGRRSGRAR